jgi:hypothetical protein
MASTDTMLARRCVGDWDGELRRKASILSQVVDQQDSHLAQIVVKGYLRSVQRVLKVLAATGEDREATRIRVLSIAQTPPSLRQQVTAALNTAPT